MRNVFDRLPKKNTEIVRSELKVLFKTTNIDVARSLRNNLVSKYSEQYSSMVECLDESFEDGFQYCAIRETNYSRLKSTNMLERVNSEIRRREKVVRIFPNTASALRLVGAVLLISMKSGHQAPDSTSALQKKPKSGSITDSLTDT